MSKIILRRKKLYMFKNRLCLFPVCEQYEVRRGRVREENEK
jgi:hypothetical protein